MLFRSNIPKSCTYCTHGTKLSEGQILCVKKGVVAEDGKCRRFSYDPCKRIPPKAKPVDFEKFDEVDYTL